MDVPNNLKLVVEKVEETHNDYLCDFKHSLRVSDNNTYCYSYNVTILVKLENVYISYSVDLPNSNGKIVPFIKKATIDICKFYQNHKGNKLLNWFYKKNTSGVRNLPTSCPIEPGNISLEDLAIDESFLAYAVARSKLFITIEFSTKINGKMVIDFCISIVMSLFKIDLMFVCLNNKV
ncbi:CLUMA_CG001218, isoform A [Clunio marinus]|uniref:CLUMA_CG001218, isoform A n=1 Tax=Clunio marinus TaxID=568069 RepID=A0A1J1HHB4_9DIPT|nr:CLUMA_CG001218, isoform A [Clunio marinus]